jgi:hypothetical protein
MKLRHGFNASRLDRKPGFDAQAATFKQSWDYFAVQHLRIFWVCLNYMQPSNGA